MSRNFYPFRFNKSTIIVHPGKVIKKKNREIVFRKVAYQDIYSIHKYLSDAQVKQA